MLRKNWRTLLSSKYTESSQFYSGSQVIALGFKFNFTVPKSLTCDPKKNYELIDCSANNNSSRLLNVIYTEGTNRKKIWKEVIN